MDAPKCKMCGERHQSRLCPGIGRAKKSRSERASDQRTLETKGASPGSAGSMKPRASRVAAGRTVAEQPGPKAPAAAVPRSLGSRGPKKGHGGRPRLDAIDKTLKATQPWLKLGMSERTWYRRQKEAKPKGQISKRMQSGASDYIVEKEAK